VRPRGRRPWLWTASRRRSCPPSARPRSRRRTRAAGAGIGLHEAQSPGAAGCAVPEAAAPDGPRRAAGWPGIVWSAVAGAGGAYRSGVVIASRGERHSPQLEARSRTASRPGIASPIRPLPVAATGNGVLAPELAAGIARVKSAKSIGVRSGNRRTLRQAQALPNAPDITTTQGAARPRYHRAVLRNGAVRRCTVTGAHRWARFGADSRRRRRPPHGTRIRRSGRYGRDGRPGGYAVFPLVAVFGEGALFNAVTGHSAESANGRHYAAFAVELGPERCRTVPSAVVGEGC
jgi:hypothetical protein